MQTLGLGHQVPQKSRSAEPHPQLDVLVLQEQVPPDVSLATQNLDGKHQGLPAGVHHRKRRTTPRQLAHLVDGRHGPVLPLDVHRPSECAVGVVGHGGHRAHVIEAQGGVAQGAQAPGQRSGVVVEPAHELDVLLVEDVGQACLETTRASQVPAEPDDLYLRPTRSRVFEKLLDFRAGFVGHEHQEFRGWLLGEQSVDRRPGRDGPVARENDRRDGWCDIWHGNRSFIPRHTEAWPRQAWASLARLSNVALIITPRYLPLLGGMERECALLAGEFKRQGWDPVIVTEQLGMALPRDENSEGIRIIRIPSSEQRTLGVQLRVAASIALITLRHRRRAAFAVVRTTTLPSLVVGLLKATGLIRFPTLVTAETGGAEDDVAALARRPLFPISRALVAANDLLNGLCQANVDHLREFGFPEAKISMIPNGIDTAPWQATRSPERVRDFLFLGRVEPPKGVFELLDAFAEVHARHPDMTLTVAGEGPSLEALRERAQALGLEHDIRFAGRVPYEQLGALFEEIDCLVLPSYSEGMPLSVLEAAAHRRSLIVTEVGDMRRLFGDRIRIVEPRNTGALAAAMEAAVNEERPRTDYAEVVNAVAIENVAAAIVTRLGVRPAGAPAPLPYLTVVTGCLNSEATIAETIRSVREQSYGGELEHIVVDGGSTDGTLEIVRAAGLRHVSEPDRGLTHALNKGIAMARGEVVGSLNADDVYVPGALQRVGEAFAANPGTEWVTGGCSIVDEHGNEIRRGVTAYKNLFLRHHSRRLHLVQNHVSAPATFARRQALQEVGGYDERFKYSADYDMWLKLGGREDPIILDSTLANFRMAGETLSLTGFETQFAEHAQNAREHGEDHPVAARLNYLTSRLIVAAYRSMRALRSLRGS